MSLVKNDPENLFLAFLKLPAEMLLRYNFGNYIIGFRVLPAVWMIWGPLIYVHAAFRRETGVVVSGAPFNFLLFITALTMLHIIIAKIRARNRTKADDEMDGYYQGRSYLERYFPETMGSLYQFVEPIFLALVGLLILLVFKTFVGTMIIISSVALGLFELQARRKLNRRLDYLEYAKVQGRYVDALLQEGITGRTGKGESTRTLARKTAYSTKQAQPAEPMPQRVIGQVASIIDRLRTGQSRPAPPSPGAAAQPRQTEPPPPQPVQSAPEEPPAPNSWRAEKERRKQQQAETGD